MLKLITKISVTKSTGISGNEITITIVNLTEILIANKSKLHFELLIDLTDENIDRTFTHKRLSLILVVDCLLPFRDSPGGISY